MKRLIEKGLMYGNLIRITAPALIARYNRALQHLSGKQTGLTDFHIDISGYSPEIGQELGDLLYLNPGGVNRQFILLTLDQRRAPLLDAKFSTSRSILRRFIDANERELFALTAQDAVTGELLNSVYDVSDPVRLFYIRRIEIEADTTSETVAKAAELGAMIDRFKAEPDAWYDDVLIADMIGLAKATGDVIRNPVTLPRMQFDQDNFWTAHFGGMYLFRGVSHPAVITTESVKAGNWPVPDVFQITDRQAIARFLEANALVEPIVKARGLDAAAILQQKMDFILAATVGTSGTQIPQDRRALRRLTRDFAQALPEAYHGLAALQRWASQGGEWPRIDADHPAYFYALRARDVPDADLVNRLLAELAPLDARQLFICHKELFYSHYSTWPDAKKAFVATFLEREYLADKAGAREALFGHDDPLEEEPIPTLRSGPWTRPAPSPEPKATDPGDLIARVGPWRVLGR